LPAKSAYCPTRRQQDVYGRTIISAGTAAIAGPAGSSSAASADQAAGLGCVALNPFYRQVTPDLVDLVHAMDMAVVVWTVNEPDDLSAMATAGVDTVISDRVTDARVALGR